MTCRASSFRVRLKGRSIASFQIHNCATALTKSSPTMSGNSAATSCKHSSSVSKAASKTQWGQVDPLQMSPEAVSNQWPLVPHGNPARNYVQPYVGMAQRPNYFSNHPLPSQCSNEYSMRKVPTESAQR